LEGAVTKREKGGLLWRKGGEADRREEAKKFNVARDV